MKSTFVASKGMSRMFRRMRRFAAVGILLAVTLGWVPLAEAGSYYGPVNQVFAFRWNGQAYIGFNMQGYDWVIPASHPMASLLSSVASAAIDPQFIGYTGCRSCAEAVFSARSMAMANS